MSHEFHTGILISLCYLISWNDNDFIRFSNLERYFFYAILDTVVFFILVVIMDSMFIRFPLLCRNILFDYLYTCIYRNLLLSRLNSQIDICKKKTMFWCMIKIIVILSPFGGSFPFLNSSKKPKSFYIFLGQLSYNYLRKVSSDSNNNFFFKEKILCFPFLFSLSHKLKYMYLYL